MQNWELHAVLDAIARRRGIAFRVASKIAQHPTSITLLEHAVPNEVVFAQAIEKYFAGKRDVKTIELLSQPVINGK